MSFIHGFGWLAVVIMILAFLCEYMDASLGMGYGTTLTPVLLFFVEDITMIVPAVLLSEFFAGVVSALFHIIFKNVHIGRKNKSNNQTNELNDNIIETRTSNGITDSSDRNVKTTENGNGFTESIDKLTRDTKIVLILAFFGVLGAIISSVIAVVFHTNEAFNFGAKIYIGLMVMAMGIIIIVLRNKEQKFSYKKIVSLGVLAGFNKGISGGGYGPITVSGQILSGREGKSAIASTSISESIVCFVGVTAYIITNVIMMNRGDLAITWEYLSWAPYLIIGAVLSAPLAALTTKKLKAKWLKIAVGWGTIALGLFSIIRYTLHYVHIW
ncbi:MAG: sulfite exporter TauE/SafE family protein [Candidatus Heimdallarchaeota archaeon]